MSTSLSVQALFLPSPKSWQAIREIHELGTGLFGKVILAEKVGLSANDLRLSESDDDKSKSTLVTVKRKHIACLLSLNSMLFMINFS